MAAVATALADAPVAEQTGRLSQIAAFRSPKILAGFALLALFVLAAIIGPMFYTTDPSALSTAALQGPSAAHLLGTTATGQDVLAQLLVGGRVSLFVGFVSAAIATVIGMVVGIWGGYISGLTDEVLSVFTNIFLVIPTLPLVIVISGYLPSRGAVSVTLVIAITGWAWGARVQRAQTLSIRRRDYVTAAKATGEGVGRILLWEILPNEMAIVVAGFLFTVIFAILTQAGLAFLGLSSVSEWSWGTMLYWAQNGQALQAGAWWWFVPPGLCIALVGCSLALINFGIDEFVNPRLRAAGITARPAALGRRSRMGMSQEPPPPPASAGVISSGQPFTAVARRKNSKRRDGEGS
jgi:peptide/nickel transport system permease protein